MTRQDLQHKETCLTESLLCALDAREAIRQSGSTLLLYLADLLVMRVREELADVQAAAADAGAPRA